MGAAFPCSPKTGSSTTYPIVWSNLKPSTTGRPCYRLSFCFDRTVGLSHSRKSHIPPAPAAPPVFPLLGARSLALCFWLAAHCWPLASPPPLWSLAYFCNPSIFPFFSHASLPALLLPLRKSLASPRHLSLLPPVPREIAAVLVLPSIV